MVTEDLLDQKKMLIAYLLKKVQIEDWHGVADAAMDLREIQAVLNDRKDS
jgi:hypothetical protein